MRLSPAATLFLGYIIISFIGGILLYLPFSHKGDLTFVDALFTSTSALCVTGLIVVDTATKYSIFGKTIIAILIQIGGLGYMTITALLFAALGSKGSIYARKLILATLGSGDLGIIIRFATTIVFISLLIELLAVPFLFIPFLKHHSPIEALGHAVFHSISALNNAGFSTFSNNLMDYANDPLVNITIMTLIVLGGLGFKVWGDIYNFVFKGKMITLHDKLVISTTAILILVPFLLFFLLEGQTRGSIWKSLFASITPRTAGFNTVDYSQMSPFSLLLTSTLMFIGGSPGGTAGGIKTVTFAIVVIWIYQTLQGKIHISAFKREIPTEVVVKSFQTFVLGISTLWLWAIILSFTERDVISGVGFIRFLFEIFSAFGTVGLSTGSMTVPNASLVADFSTFGKLMIILAMIIGRAGYLIFAASLIQPKRVRFRYAKGEVIV
ncbi:MAG: potassium transporter TrkG [candidate division WOR-3 bacterium]